MKSFKSYGIFADWSNPYLTLDPKYKPCFSEWKGVLFASLGFERSTRKGSRLFIWMSLALDWIQLQDIIYTGKTKKRGIILTNSHRQRIISWIDGTGQLSATFDFTTKGVLQEAVKGQLWRLCDPQGKPPGVIQ
ncbi:alpha-amylase type B isozyme-like isoform X2 [Rosa chinensis]|uniref:alpha-amylase type B isozyme-like isoform X2 n=1 Tax=Rosa chinensis TaxID=74649 RepID=UPI001AD8B676|nr:alpha-amylase type B isozyme-like isoform X2 [Rosa chinensis]